MKPSLYFLMLQVSCSLLVYSYVSYAQVDIAWDKSYGGSENETFSTIIATADGGYLLAGHSNSDASGDKSEDSRGGFDYWIIKTDEQGNQQWDKTLGGSKGEYISSAASTDDGGYVLTGYSFSDVSGDKSENSRGESDYWIIKMDESGNKVWDKTLGGNGRDEPSSILTTSTGNYLLAGTSFSDASADKSEDSKGPSDFWVVSLAETENASSVTTFHLGHHEGGEGGTIITELGDGAVFDLTEQVEISGEPSDVTYGEIDMYLTADVSPNHVDSVKFELDGPIQHAHTSSGPVYTLFGADDDLIQGRKWLPGRYTLTATPYVNDVKGKPLTISFEMIQGVSLGRTRFTLVNANTDEYITGLSEGRVINLRAWNINSTPLTVRAITSPGVIDSIKLGLQGPISHRQTERNYPYALFGDEPKAGGGRDLIGRQWLPGTYTLTGTPYGNDMPDTPVSITLYVSGNSSKAALAVEVYPVPTTGVVNISHEGVTEQAHLMLLDFAGNVVLEQPLSRQTVEQLDLSSFRKGFYYLKVIQQQQVQVKRIVLE